MDLNFIWEMGLFIILCSYKPNLINAFHSLRKKKVGALAYKQMTEGNLFSGMTQCIGIGKGVCKIMSEAKWCQVALK